jgi:hypothetical protein
MIISRIGIDRNCLSGFGRGQVMPQVYKDIPNLVHQCYGVPPHFHREVKYYMQVNFILTSELCMVAIRNCL